ncbi:MAG: acetate kinase [Bacteroidales bacterium]|nr:acetate kinase [Bacteroidales bacterium]
MKILVINCGSSSLKYQLIDMPSGDLLAKGGVEKIGLPDSFLKCAKGDGPKTKIEKPMNDHQDAIELVLNTLTDKELGVIASLNEIEAAGHRVLHGGEFFKESVIINDDVIAKIEEIAPLGPLHQMANLKGIRAMKKAMPSLPQVAVFDTAFHQTIPDYAYMYAIPYELYEKLHIRRYGFHGTSHRYVSKRACEILGLDYNNSKLITCHIGNGASLAAIVNGKVVDTSMGLTPCEGVVMGTRCGVIDPAVFPYLFENGALKPEDMNNFINKQSGVLGVSGVSSDMRDVEEAAFERKEYRAALACKMQDYSIKKYIGAYMAAMNGCDAIVFCGGIGEKGDTTRRGVAMNLEWLGVEFDDSINTGLRDKEMVISKPTSKVKVVVVPTNEELVIAQDTLDLVKR